ncbi:MAG: hypothetical protein ACI9EW_000263 [Cellvibrionaceae bacterium]|jgi:hypothetical protein
MITPDGRECRFYYENFHRGASDQECRLVEANANSAAWKPADCKSCPVPDILKSNSDPNLILEANVKSGFMGFNRKVEIKAFCSKHLINVPQPKTGCPRCNSEKPGLKELEDLFK